MRACVRAYILEIKVMYIPGQGLRLQLSVSSVLSESGHSFPPFCGFGLSHFRVLVFSPEPQVAGQVLHSVQSLQPPFTAPVKEFFENVKLFVIMQFWTKPVNISISCNSVSTLYEKTVCEGGKREIASGRKTAIERGRSESGKDGTNI